MKRSFISTLIITAVLMLSACEQQTSSPSPTTADLHPPTLQILEITLTPTSTNAATVPFSSEQLGLCFSYPRGYTSLPESDTVEVIAPALTGSDTREIFWLEISDAYDRTAEVIVDQDVVLAGNVDVKRWTTIIGGEQAVVLEGMPGQDPQRRVYVVHQQTLYVLAFMPTLSQDKAISDQLEELYNAITTSWAWSPCAASN
jgi:hypothetical protein